MKWTPLQKPGREANAGDGLSPAAHCLALTLIGVAAIAVSIFLPPDKPTRPLAKVGQSAQVRKPPASADEGGRPAEVRPDQRAAEPVDYFPAQFPPPTGDTGEQAPTF
jgi:hypothetical protein